MPAYSLVRACMLDSKGVGWHQTPGWFHLKCLINCFKEKIWSLNCLCVVVFYWLPLTVNTLRSRQNGRHFAGDIFKCIFLNGNVWILIKISIKFVPKGPINNIPTLVQIMAWCRPGDKPLAEPMMVSLTTHICVTRPQWVKIIHYIDRYCSKSILVPALYSDWHPMLLFESSLSSAFWNVLSYSVIRAYSVSDFEKCTTLFHYFSLLCYLELRNNIQDIIKEKENMVGYHNMIYHIIMIEVMIHVG